MGIPGLTTYVNDRPHFFRNHRLHHTRVVIDGNCMKYHLFDRYKIDYIHGGDYDSIAEKTKAFCDKLKKCGISPYIVFDGGHEPDDRKFHTLIQRLNERIRRSEIVSGGGRALVIPLLTNDVIRQTLTDLSVPHVVCEFEADYELALLANDFGCPVLSQDSDFNILPLQGGYIPFDSIGHNVQKWKDIDGSGYLKYLSCKIYHYTSLTEQFPALGVTALPLLATFAGNDYVEAGTFEHVLRKVSLDKASSTKKISKSQLRLMKSMKWLKDAASIKEATKKIITSVATTDRDQLKNILDKSIQYFTLTPEYSKFRLSVYFENQNKAQQDFCSMSPQIKAFDGRSIPKWFIDAHRRGDVGNMLLNAFVKRRLLLKSPVEDIHQQSVFTCSIPIRKQVYGIMTKGFPCALPQYPADDLDVNMTSPVLKSQTNDVHTDETVRGLFCVEEFNRKGGKMARYVVDANLGTPSMLDIQSLHLNRRRQIMADALGVNLKELKEFSDNYVFLIGIVVFWVRNSDPKTSPNEYKALLACVVALFVKRAYLKNLPHASYDSLVVAYRDKNQPKVADMMKKLSIYNKKADHSSRNPLDISVVHSFQQFQTVLLSALRLNQLLLFPYPSLNPAEVMRGRFLYNMTIAMRSVWDAERFLENKFVHQSPMSLFLRKLIHAVSLCVDSSCFCVIKPPIEEGPKSSMNNKVAPPSCEQSLLDQYGGSRYMSRDAICQKQRELIQKLVNIIDDRNKRFDQYYFSGRYQSKNF